MSRHVLLESRVLFCDSAMYVYAFVCSKEEGNSKLCLSSYRAPVPLTSFRFLYFLDAMINVLCYCTFFQLVSTDKAEVDAVPL